MITLHPAADESCDAFLGGRVRLLQPRRGYRVSMDTVLLAGAVPARGGQHVLDMGTGSGGAALMLARRVSGVQVTGRDHDPHMTALAQRNAQLNDLHARVQIETADVRTLAGDGSRFDHVMLNPPYLAAGAALASPYSGKQQAHMGAAEDLAAWLRAGVHDLKARGSLTVIHRADRLDVLIAALYGKLGDLRILPLQPQAGQPPRRVLVQGLKSSQGVCRLLPPLVLHAPGRRYSQAAEAILRDGAPLVLKDFAPGSALRY